MSRHIELSVEINPVWSEYVSDILIRQIGCSGAITEEFKYENDKLTEANISTVKGYLWFNGNKLPDIDKIQDILLKNKEELMSSGVSEANSGSWKLKTKEIDDEEWAHSWKKYWHPQKIGSKIVICPSWEEFEPENEEIKINLDPGSAFGTGTHPTTRLCIMAIEKYLRPESSMADVGTGSGILSVAGIKLGAKKAIGVDNDASVIEVARDNAKINNISDKCEFQEGSASDIKENFDVVVSNILAEVLISIMNTLANLVKTDGIIILSGIIVEKSGLVKKSAEDAGFRIIETLEEGNWVAIVASNSQRKNSIINLE